MTVGWPPANGMVSTSPYGVASPPHPIAASTVRPSRESPWAKRSPTKGVSGLAVAETGSGIQPAVMRGGIGGQQAPSVRRPRRGVDPRPGMGELSEIASAFVHHPDIAMAVHAAIRAEALERDPPGPHSGNALRSSSVSRWITPEGAGPYRCRCQSRWSAGTRGYCRPARTRSSRTRRAAGSARSAGYGRRRSQRRRRPEPPEVANPTTTPAAGPEPDDPRRAA